MKAKTKFKQTEIGEIPEDWEIIEDHDGIQTKRKKGTTLNMTTYNFLDIINNEDDPRRIILNGQLHLEFMCDNLIMSYFQSEDGLRNGILSNFLHSEEISFMTKIKLLKKLTYSGKDGKPERFVDTKITKGLSAIAQIRNGFQHNISYTDALKHATKEGNNFGWINKELSECKNLQELIENFKQEYKKLYFALHEIILKMGEQNKNKISKLLENVKAKNKIQAN